MNQNKLSSRVYTLIKSAAAAAVLPVLVIYIMIAKPDYRIMNAMGHIVVPVAQWTGDAITWPVRAVGNIFANLSELSNLRAENEELRAQLDAALQNKYTCDIAIAEIQKLSHELDVVHATPHGTVLADVMHDNHALGHDTLLINRGSDRGIEPGMIVISTDGMLVGQVIDAGVHFSRVQTLIDVDSNIPVRVAGSEVYGFMRGNGSSMPFMEFFSDPEFQASDGVTLVTSNISVTIPGDIFVGTMTDDTYVKITDPKRLSRVIVLKFDTATEYNR